MSYVVAGLVAALLAAVELRSRLRSAPTAKGGAPLWWSVRLGLEVGLSAIALGVARGTITQPWAKGLLGAALAGAAGPAVARLQVMTIGKGSHSRPFGLASIYEPLRDFFEDQIDEIGAEQESQLINDVVLPHIKQVGKTPDELGDRLRVFISALSDRRLGAAAKKRELDFIDATLADKVDDDRKIKVLVLRARQIGAYRTIRNFAGVRTAG